jgi:hypothetical protein
MDIAGWVKRRKFGVRVRPTPHAFGGGEAYFAAGAFFGGTILTTWATKFAFHLS